MLLQAQSCCAPFKLQITLNVKEMEIKKFLIDNWDKIIGIGLAYFALLLPIYKYLQEKRLEEKDKRFLNYHKLIDELVGGFGKIPMLDRQIAIVFELRNFKEYYPVTLRILTSLKQTWTASQDPKNNRLIDEINFTEQHIKSHQ